jgi:hypothetical protein
MTNRRLRNLVVAVPALAFLTAAEGDCTLLQLKGESPIQTVTTILEYPDGHVEADVAIVTVEDGDARFVESARNVELRIPGGELVTLEMAEPGHYRLSSQDDPRLVYAPGETYRVSFEIDDEADAGKAAGGDFLAVVDAPADEVTAEFTPPEFAGDTSEIHWEPGSLAGLLEVRDATGEIVFTTFDWSHPEFDGSKWASLIWGGDHELRVDVFADPGTYTLSFCAVESQEGLDEELSAGMGIASGFMIGRCIDDVVVEVVP